MHGLQSTTVTEPPGDQVSSQNAKSPKRKWSQRHVADHPRPVKNLKVAARPPEIIAVVGKEEVKVFTLLPLNQHN